VLTRLVTALPDAMAAVIGDERLLPTERDFLRSKVFPVIDERCSFVRAALKVPSAAKRT
jgi:serine/threonine-protein kinase HipA